MLLRQDRFGRDMNEGTSDFRAEDRIAVSGGRCERQHGLMRDFARPIMRLQSSKFALRPARIVERTGGRPFACTGASIVDTQAVSVGPVNVVTFDQGRLP